MCQQCLTNSIVLCRLGKFSVQEAVVSSDEWKQGTYGLVEVNDPSFYFTVKPRPEPADTGDETADTAAFMKWDEEVEAFNNEILSSGSHVTDFFDLVNESIKEGYNREDDGSFSHWLFDFLGKKLINPVQEEGEKNERASS